MSDRVTTTPETPMMDLTAPDDIPFPETKAYVQDILDAWAIYRRSYGDELASPT